MLNAECPLEADAHTFLTILSPACSLAEAQTKVRKALFERFQTSQQTLDALDTENPAAGVIATSALRRGLETLVPALNASELDTIAEALDPRDDGVVLKSDISQMLLARGPDSSSFECDIEQLAEERARRGIYQLLRSRQAHSPSTPSPVLGTSFSSQH